jgi:hypothetical protein
VRDEPHAEHAFCNLENLSWSSVDHLDSARFAAATSMNLGLYDDDGIAGLGDEIHGGRLSGVR